MESLHPSLNDEGLIDVCKLLYLSKLIYTALPRRVETGEEYNTVSSQPISYTVSVVKCDDGGYNHEKIEKSSSYGSLLGSLTIGRNCPPNNVVTEAQDSERKSSPYHSYKEINEEFKVDNTIIKDGGDIGIDVDSAVGKSGTTIARAHQHGKSERGRVLCESGPSLVVYPSFEDACEACRESLFEPIRNSFQTLGTEVVNENVDFKWDVISKCITVKAAEETPQTSRTKQKSDHASVSAKSSEILSAFFSPTERATVVHSGPLLAGKSREKLFELVSTDKELIDLLWKIQR